MKLFSYQSRAVRPLWDIFFKSVKEKTSFEFYPQPIPTEFDGANYGEPRYWKLMRWMGLDKMRLIMDNWGEVITITGCDMEFYGDAALDLKARIKNLDFLTPENEAGIKTSCGCLQVLRCGHKTHDFYDAVYNNDKIGTVPDDPLIDKYRGMVSYALLPRELYWNACGSLWTIGKPIPEPPKTIIWFHGNWCLGLENKVALLNGVRAKMRGETKP